VKRSSPKAWSKAGVLTWNARLKTGAPGRSSAGGHVAYGGEAQDPRAKVKRPECWIIFII
jgi:hypothetical protein